MLNQQSCSQVEPFDATVHSLNQTTYHGLPSAPNVLKPVRLLDDVVTTCQFVFRIVGVASLRALH